MPKWFRIPERIMRPVLLLPPSGKGGMIVEHDDYVDLVADKCAKKMPADNIETNRGRITVKVAKLVLLEPKARGSSARMSPPDPRKRGILSLYNFYFNILDSMASDSESDFGKSAREIVEAWNPQRTLKVVLES